MPGFSRRIYTPGALWRDTRELMRHAYDLHLAARGGRVSRAFAEKIMLAVTAVNGCRYCSYAHTRAALQSGVSRREIELLLGGKVGHAAPEEAPALLFAQHYAESCGQPDPEILQKLISTYGPEHTRDILIYIRMIMWGNLIGNTFDALLSRLRGLPAEHSSLWNELATLLLAVVLTPIMAVGIVINITTHHKADDIKIAASHARSA